MSFLLRHYVSKDSHSNHSKTSSRKNALINEATSATSKFWKLPKLLQADVGPCKRRCSLCTKEQIGDSFPLRKPPWTSGNEKLKYILVYNKTVTLSPTLFDWRINDLANLLNAVEAIDAHRAGGRGGGGGKLKKFGRTNAIRHEKRRPS